MTTNSVPIFKRISKLNKGLQTSPKSKASKKTLIRAKDQAPSYRFVMIPPSRKFLHTSQTCLFSGDIPLIEYHNDLLMDVSLFNEFMIYQSVGILDKFDERIVSVKPIRRLDQETFQIEDFVSKLEQSESPGIQDWAKTLKDFHLKYDKVMKRQSHKKKKTNARKKFFSEISTKTQQKIDALFEKYPCVQMKYRLKDHQNILKALLFNEKYAVETGYTIERFTTAIIQEGVPQMLSFESPNISPSLKSIFENYFNKEGRNGESISMYGTLLMKNGFVRDITYQVYFLMNYENNTFGTDIVIAITSHSEPYFQQGNHESTKLNYEFIQAKIAQEMEAQYLLSEYYDISFPAWYSNHHKVCQIKEIITQDDEKQIKIEEDEDDDDEKSTGSMKEEDEMDL